MTKKDNKTTTDTYLIDGEEVSAEEIERSFAWGGLITPICGESDLFMPTLEEMEHVEEAIYSLDYDVYLEGLTPEQREWSAEATLTDRYVWLATRLPERLKSESLDSDLVLEVLKEFEQSLVAAE